MSSDDVNDELRYYKEQCRQQSGIIEYLRDEVARLTRKCRSLQLEVDESDWHIFKQELRDKET